MRMQHLRAIQQVVMDAIYDKNSEGAEEFVAVFVV